jgi:hypothetical protein
MRYGVGQSKCNEVDRTFLLPVWETIGRKTDILVRIEKLQVIHPVGVRCCGKGNQQTALWKDAAP